MRLTPQILPVFSSLAVIDEGHLPPDYETNCAYLLSDGMNLSDFLGKVGKEYEAANKPFDFYDFYAAYNLTFPTTPSTVYLMNEQRIIAAGINDMANLLTLLKTSGASEGQCAVYLCTAERTPDAMLKFKREIFQQFIYLRMYLPIVIADTAKEAREIFAKLLNPSEDEQSAVTFIGTKKAGKSSLINAILGAEYSPASSELPTPNQVTYAKGHVGHHLHLDYAEQHRDFATADDLREYLAAEFRRANRDNSAALETMHVYIHQFPVELSNFTIVDTPGPNLAASKGKAHATAALAAFKEMLHGVFVMNYSAHLTDDEIKLFDQTYKVFNNKRRHQTVIVAVNRIDEMYAADVIKSYERFADYVRQRLLKLGYENFVVVGVSAKTAVFSDKLKAILPAESGNLDEQLADLEPIDGTEDYNTVIDFVEDSVKRMWRFYRKKIMSLAELRKTSRIDYLKNVIAVAYNPAEHFEWIDETFEDIWEEDFTDDREFAERVRHFAEEGDADAMNVLGVLYSRGDGVQKDDELALEWCLLAAHAGNPAAMANVAYSLRYGEGTNKDLENAVKWYEKAVAEGNTNAMYELAQMYRYGDEIKKNADLAYKYCRQAAEASEVDAMVALAAMYFRGDCVNQDLSKSFEWNVKAAQLENTIAMCNVAYCYHYGEGTTKNLTKAIEWYNNAVALGSTKAMCDLAEIYRNDEDIEKDEHKVFLLYKQAAEADDVEAMTNVAYLYRNGEGVAKDINRALEWYNKAIDAGNTRAMYELAIMYRNGEDIEKDARKAFLLCKQAAEGGENEAMYSLACMYDFGDETATDHKQAFIWYKKSAEAGNILAMNRLGVMYDNGEGVEVDHQAAVTLYQEAAKGGLPTAMSNLAYSYRYGEGINKSFSDATYWYEQSIENGNDDALYDLGDMYYDNGYYVKAFKFLKQAAEKGNADAMNRIGLMYSEGNGTEENAYQAAHWYQNAAENGHMWGMYNLASCLYHGRGIQQDYNAAMKWYSKAADAGNVDAMNELGDMHYNGDGITPNYTDAVRWYRKAAEKGHGWAMWNLGYCYQRGYGVGTSINDASGWYKKAAEAGIDDALKQLGGLYYNQENYREAIKWYEKAADRGDADCMNYLGVMFHDGKGTTRDYANAFYWYQRAAKAGSMWALNNMGNAYCNGQGVSQNYKKAFEHYRRAANEGNITSSMISLGNMYRYGNGVEKDYDKAKFWYEKAHEHGDSDAQEFIRSLYEEREDARRRNSSNSSSSGCFITTAVCTSFGKADDCYELTAFRNFRDHWLANQPDGYSLIAEYYAIAPIIVIKINQLPNSKKIYRSIWDEYLKSCLSYIEQGSFAKCKETYINMVRELAKKY